jgi:isopentenyldiphosphate isomerase
MMEVILVVADLDPIRQELHGKVTGIVFNVDLENTMIGYVFNVQVEIHILVRIVRVELSLKVENLKMSRNVYLATKDSIAEWELQYVPCVNLENIPIVSNQNVAQTVQLELME